jgi:hypothetical protein
MAAVKTAPKIFRDEILRANIILFSLFEEPLGRRYRAAAWLMYTIVAVRPRRHYGSRQRKPSQWQREKFDA